MEDHRSLHALMVMQSLEFCVHLESWSKCNSAYLDTPTMNIIRFPCKFVFRGNYIRTSADTIAVHAIFAVSVAHDSGDTVRDWVPEAEPQ